MPQTVLTFLRRLNLWVASLVGVVLLACAVFILADIILRQLGSSFGGTDEISGYVMAIVTSWGMAFTMLELGHVRIDILRSQLASRGRVIMDLFSQAVLALTISVIAFQCWPVVANSIQNSSTANTPLETPLTLVQMPWFLGWTWFALNAWITLAAAAVLTLRGDYDSTESAIGAFAEQETMK
ncbi:TRAP transporter small permease [Maribius pontilimi]|uniref:TRAP transporter small permease protein n=1 Tax=Palleronia pontilimi TaxID=1964209 RepID=A0A934IIQ6_9RHOB|nr:TRAP transporter small permease [Palleronia pontilimi]MBJ3763767.1 TRAP transporter small permease [Palleronia pontilimi]